MSEAAPFSVTSVTPISPFQLFIAFSQVDVAWNVQKALYESRPFRQNSEFFDRSNCPMLKPVRRRNLNVVTDI